MDWVSLEIEVQEHALAIWLEAAEIVLTNEEPRIVETEIPAAPWTSQSGKQQGILPANLIPLASVAIT